MCAPVRYNRRLTLRSRTPDETTADLSRLQRVAARDSSALAELYDEHSRLLFGLILRILKDRGRRRKSFRKSSCRRGHAPAPTTCSSGHLSGGWWVSRAIARSIACAPTRCMSGPSKRFRSLPRSKRRRGARRSSEKRRDVQRALAALPAEQRELIELAYFLGFTHSELAARFSLPLGTVKTRIRTGMITLRGQLEARLMGQ